MRHRSALLLGLAATFCLSACGDRTEDAGLNQTAMDNMAISGAATEGAMPTVPAPAAAGDFVAKVAVSDLFEVESAKAVLERSRSKPIRDFATMMIAEHSATTAKLKAIVAQAGMPAPPAVLDERHADRLAKLRNASADDLDGDYLDQQEDAHAQALTLLDTYAHGGDNPALKAFAAEVAPKVRGHLDRVKALDEAGVDDAAKPAR